MIYGIEQEYTFMRLNGRPFGFPEHDGEPGPQGPYYCGVGAGRVMGREIVEIHTQACLDAGLGISGTNAEVMPGQWEFQVGPLDALTVSDQMYVARWLLHRVAEEFDVVVSFDAKPQKGDWNGAGAHTNFSTKAMRSSYDAIEAACKAIGGRVMEHVKNYGHDIESRLTGKHETAPWNQFSYGVSNRGASIRIPWQSRATRRAMPRTVVRTRTWTVRRHPPLARDGLLAGKTAGELRQKEDPQVTLRGAHCALRCAPRRQPATSHSCADQHGG